MKALNLINMGKLYINGKEDEAFLNPLSELEEGNSYLINTPVILQGLDKKYKASSVNIRIKLTKRKGLYYINNNPLGTSYEKIWSFISDIYIRKLY